MNPLIICLTILMLFKNKTYSWPIHEADSTYEAVTAEVNTMETTITTTTTLPPEVDREWEDLVLAGPTVVNYLGLFMVLVSRQDQALEIPYGGTVKHIENVYSLRATIFQISSAMQVALKLARDDLVRVQSSMNQIPEHVKAGLLIIKMAPHNLLNELLPYTLRNVGRASNEGSTVSKPTIDRFTSIKLLLDELVRLLDYTTSVHSNTGFLVEAKIYASDLKKQWGFMLKLFQKLSERTDSTNKSINDSYVGPIDEMQRENGFDTQSGRSDNLAKLIPTTILIDQSSYLLDVMTHTYTDISNDHMEKQMILNNNYSNLTGESLRIESQRQLWQNIVLQSVKIARLAQERHNKFVDSSVLRQAEYTKFLQGVLSP